MSRRRDGLSRDELARLNEISTQHGRALARKGHREIEGRRYAVYDANEMLETLSRIEHRTYRPGIT